MKLRNVLPLFLFLCAFPAPLPAAENVFTGQDIILDGLRQSYRLRIEDALTTFSVLEKDHPESPAARFYPVAVNWGYIEADVRWNRLAEMYALSEPPDNVREESIRLLNRLRRVIVRLERMREKTPDDFETVFYLAGAYGFAARMEIYRGNYIGAFFNGKSSARYFNSLLEKWPDRGDSKLGPGVHRYYVGRLSTPMQWLVSLLGLSGDKKEGLKLIEEAYHTAILGRAEAADFLARIYGRHEGELDRALYWADRLEEMLPQAPLADYHRLTVAYKRDDLNGQEAALSSLLQITGGVEDTIRRRWEPLLRYCLGVVKLKKEEYEEASLWFDKAMQADVQDKWLKREIQMRYLIVKKNRP